MYNFYRHLNLWKVIFGSVENVLLFHWVDYICMLVRCTYIPEHYHFYSASEGLHSLKMFTFLIMNMALASCHTSIITHDMWDAALLYTYSTSIYTNEQLYLTASM